MTINRTLSLSKRPYQGEYCHYPFHQVKFSMEYHLPSMHARTQDKRNMKGKSRHFDFSLQTPALMSVVTHIHLCSNAARTISPRYTSKMAACYYCRLKILKQSSFRLLFITRKSLQERRCCYGQKEKVSIKRSIDIGTLPFNTDYKVRFSVLHVVSPVLRTLIPVSFDLFKKIGNRKQDRR